VNDMSLKAKIRNLADSKNISAQAVLQNYLLRRFLCRMARSEHRERFVVKGGMLISSIIGIDHRSTMDLDTILRNLPLTEGSIQSAFQDIIEVHAEDGIEFSLDRIEPIRDDDEYGGYRISFSARYGKINAPMSMDVSTGDVITPDAVRCCFTDMFDSEDSFELWAYPVETVLAEKMETILSRGIDNTRPRDYYDVYMLSGVEFDSETLRRALFATAKHRNSLKILTEYDSILSWVGQDGIMENRWKAYSKQMPYAKGITWTDVVSAVAKLAAVIFEDKEL